MRVIKQNSARNITILMVDAADHMTGKTGLSLTIYASKDGSSFTSITPAVTELNYGCYKLELTAGHTSVLGDLCIHVTGTGADPLDIMMQVVAYDPDGANSLGLAYLDVAISGRAAPGDSMNLASGAITSTQIATGAITSGSFGAGAITATVAPNLDAAVSTRAAESAGNLSAVKAKTDNLPALPAAQGDVMALSSAYDAAKTAASQTSVTSVASDVGTIKNTDLPAVKSTVDSLYNTSVPAVKSDTATIMAKTNLIGASIALETGGNLAAVKAQTDLLPANPAGIGDAMTLTGPYDAAKTASSATQVTTLQGDVTIIKGTDLPAVKSDTAAIKAKTDNLPGAPAATGDAMTLTAAYDAAKTAASQASVTDLDTDLTFLRRALTNKKRWDSGNSRWIIYTDDGITPLYYLKVYNPADGNVVLGSNSIAHGDKVA